MTSHSRAVAFAMRCALFSALFAALFSVTLGCSGGPDTPEDPSKTPPSTTTESDVPPAPELEPFEQELAGATYRIPMVPIPANGELGGYWVSAVEIPWDAYDVYVYKTDLKEGLDEPDAVTRPSKPYIPPDRGYGHNGYPAISMTFAGAEGFCVWLSERSGRKYRLLTEEEWQDLCVRGGAPAAPDDVWSEDNSGGVPMPIAGKPANALGLHDLLGNVAEWCRDAAGGPVVLGGSYRDSADAVTCGRREVPDSSWQATDPQIPKSPWWTSDCGWVGFRVVCEP